MDIVDRFSQMNSYFAQMYIGGAVGQCFPESSPTLAADPYARFELGRKIGSEA